MTTTAPSLSPPSADLSEAERLYPSLTCVDPPLASLAPACGPLSVPAGTPLFSAHSPCQGFPLVLEGEVKVTQPSSDGRSLELYRVAPGELCLVSSACLFRQQLLSANGVASRATRLMLIPPPVFERWLVQPEFRSHVLGLFAQRMADLSGLIDAVAFQKLDQRLATALLGHGPELAVTHQALADQLGTVREIVTRLLRRFEQEGLVQLGRELIRITDSAGLRRLAAGAG